MIGIGQPDDGITSVRRGAAGLLRVHKQLRHKGQAVHDQLARVARTSRQERVAVDETNYSPRSTGYAAGTVFDLVDSRRDRPLVPYYTRREGQEAKKITDVETRARRQEPSRLATGDTRTTAARQPRKMGPTTT